MGDWESFVAETPWFVEDGAAVVVGDTRPWARGPIDALPTLSTLLTAATVTTVSVADRPYELLAWGPPGRRRGWLCEPPTAGDVHEIHRGFWSVCGGIVERFAEPGSWWLNQDTVLTADAARTDVAAVLDAYSWIWDDGVPIDPSGYYAAAIEANGNLTLVDRRDGRLLLFAPDHAFSRVTPLPGCPPYSLLTIDGVPDLASWIEECASAWLDG
ncbi:MAG: hypothetical protein M3422_08010 [Actinomycetota bacterium]|nr:hypothetical protein [Actinomycetota bacterium]